MVIMEKAFHHELRSESVDFEVFKDVSVGYFPYWFLWN